MVVTDFKYTLTEPSDSDMKSNRKRLVEQSQLESCSLVLRSFHSCNSFLNLSLSLAHKEKRGTRREACEENDSSAYNLS